MSKELRLPYPIIDHHLWEVAAPERADGGFGKDYLAPHLKRDWESARVKMAGTVYLQCGWKGPQWGETAWCQSVAEETNGVVNAAIIGQCDLLQPYDVVERELKEHMRFKNFRGIRFLVSHDPEQRPHTTNHVSEPDAYRNPTLQKNLELFAKYNLSFDLWCYAHQLPGAIELVKLHPNVNFVLDHFASPILVASNPSTYALWLRDITSLSQLPNAYAKISGLMPVLGLHAARKMTARQLADSVFGDLVRDTIRLFGPLRCMFGSNFPVDKAEALYDTLVECYLLIMREMGLSEEQIKEVFYGTAARFYRIFEFAPKGGKL